MSNLPIPPAPGTHLVVGAGEVGSAAALLLADAGVDVVLVSRSGRGPERAGIRRVAADASSVEALLAAAPGAVAVYNCVNPEYTRWTADWPPMAQAFLDYAERTGAVLATVSNLSGYGPVDVPMTEDLPLAAAGEKAQVRVRMWRDAKAANDSGRIRATEVRGSDYICPGPQSMLGDRVMPRILATSTSSPASRRPTARAARPTAVASSPTSPSSATCAAAPGRGAVDSTSRASTARPRPAPTGRPPPVAT